jgi:phage protein D
MQSGHIPVKKEHRIMLSKKPYIENHRKLAENKLVARLEFLKSKGKTAEQIQRDPKVKHHRAAIRKAEHRLASIAKLESQIARKAEIKAEKLAAAKTDHAKRKRSAPDPEKKRAKKEKKAAEAKAETDE